MIIEGQSDLMSTRDVKPQKTVNDSTESFLSQISATKKTSELRGESAEMASLEHQPRTGRIYLFLFVVTSFTLTSNYIGSLNQMKQLLQVKLGWEADSP